MADRDYTNDNQQNLMRVIEYLAQDILIPKSQQELAEVLDLSKDKVFRTLWNLEEQGWVEASAGGYRLSPRMTRISDQLRLAVADVIRKHIPDSLDIKGTE